MNHCRIISIPLVAMLLLAAPAFGAGLEVQKVTHNIYALVGDMGQRSPENLGNNATFGVVITSAGVVLIDSGGSNKGAQQIAAAIKTLTDKPVVLVINTGGQDHRWFGNSYFKQQGARIIASAAAVADQKARFGDELTVMDRFVGKAGMAGTRDVYANETYTAAKALTVGDTVFELKRVGPAHTPGDAYVWLPKRRVVLTGDVVFVERLLGVLPPSNSRNWISAFDQIAALKPLHVVPGHGHATNLATARRDTYDYLVFLRKAVKAVFDKDGGLEAAAKVDQSKFDYLKVYEELKGRNAQQVYQELEWE